MHAIKGTLTGLHIPTDFHCMGISVNVIFVHSYKLKDIMTLLSELTCIECRILSEKKSKLSETDDYQQVGQSQVILTRKELSFEASLGHGVVWFELNTHTVELGRDRLWFLCATVFPMKLCICGQAAVYLNVIIFTNLQTDGHIALPLWSKDYLVLVTLLQVTHKSPA